VKEISTGLVFAELAKVGEKAQGYGSGTPVASSGISAEEHMSTVGARC